MIANKNNTEMNIKIIITTLFAILFIKLLWKYKSGIYNMFTALLEDFVQLTEQEHHALLGRGPRPIQIRPMPTYSPSHMHFGEQLGELLDPYPSLWTETARERFLNHRGQQRLLHHRGQQRLLHHHMQPSHRNLPVAEVVHDASPSGTTFTRAADGARSRAAF